jgi:hypothetical protein
MLLFGILSGGGSNAFSSELETGVPKNSVLFLGWQTGVEGFFLLALPLLLLWLSAER